MCPRVAGTLIPSAVSRQTTYHDAGFEWLGRRSSQLAGSRISGVGAARTNMPDLSGTLIPSAVHRYTLAGPEKGYSNRSEGCRAQAQHSDAITEAALDFSSFSAFLNCSDEKGDKSSLQRGCNSDAVLFPAEISSIGTSSITSLKDKAGHSFSPIDSTLGNYRCSGPAVWV